MRSAGRRPTRRRVGYYGNEHLERLRVIGELQAQGLNLKAVKQLLDDAQGTVERLLSLRRSIAEPVSLEQSEVLTDAELSDQLKGAGPELPKLLDKLQQLGFVVPIGADQPPARARPAGAGRRVQPHGQPAHRCHARRRDQAVI